MSNRHFALPLTALGLTLSTVAATGCGSNGLMGEWLLTSIALDGNDLSSYFLDGYSYTYDGCTYTAAFLAEVFRSGIEAVPRALLEAADTLGATRWQQVRLVLIPQALRTVVPPTTNQYLNLIKNSSLAVAVGYPDLVSVTTTALNQSGRVLECIGVMMAVYLTLSLLTALAMNAFNRSHALKGVA